MTQRAVVPLRHVAPPAIKGRGRFRPCGRGRKSPSLRGRKQGGRRPPGRCRLRRGDAHDLEIAARIRRLQRGRCCREQGSSPAHCPFAIHLILERGKEPGRPRVRGASRPSRFPGPGLADIRRPCGAQTAAEPWVSATAASVGVRHSPKWGAIRRIAAATRPATALPQRGSRGGGPSASETADTAPRYRSVSYRIRHSCLHRAGARVTTPSPARPRSRAPGSTGYLATATAGARFLLPPSIGSIRRADSAIEVGCGKYRSP